MGQVSGSSILSASHYTRTVVTTSFFQPRNNHPHLMQGLGGVEVLAKGGGVTRCAIDGHCCRSTPRGLAYNRLWAHRSGVR